MMSNPAQANIAKQNMNDQSHENPNKLMWRNGQLFILVPLSNIQYLQPPSLNHIQQKGRTGKQIEKRPEIVCTYGQCKKVFYRKSLLKQHMKRHHLQNPLIFG